MYAIINGYGVPKDIDTDLNYNSYLGQVFTYLWERYHGEPLQIILCGGPTDMVPPYRRTEAGEMARWFKRRMRELKLSRWRLRLCAKGLHTLENMLDARKVVRKKRALYFCERTRYTKVRTLSRKVFGTSVRVIAIEFDASPTRYDLKTRTALEREDLRYSVRALKDSAWRRRLNDANKEKIKVLRQTPPSKRRTDIDRITSEIRRAYMKSL